ncbi:hypothetical protein Dimus_006581 [Dionaea muscipula]
MSDPDGLGISKTLWRMLSHLVDISENCSMKERKDGYEPDGKFANSLYSESLYNNLEDGELSWFNAGVRVGVGIGLGMCLGLGIGVRLLSNHPDVQENILLILTMIH